MKKLIVLISTIAVGIVFLAGCSSVPDGKPAMPTTGADKLNYKNEGAHFESPFEYWYVTGHLDTDEGRLYFATHFHRVGSVYMQTRNAYNSLRLPDGSYDYRSVGDGFIQTLTGNKLKEKMERYPDMKIYKEIHDKLVNNESEHFTYVPEEDRPMYRNKLFIRMNKNSIERATDTTYLYNLKLDTWAGLLDLKMEAVSEPVRLFQDNIVHVGGGSLIWYAKPWLDVKGTFDRNGKQQQVSGEAWMTHMWGTPDPRAMYSQEFIMLRLNNGGAFLLINLYDKDKKLANTKFVYQKPDGTLETGMKVTTEPVDTWKSKATFETYNTGWKTSGDFTGTVKALYPDSEIMLDYGVGAFWLGPCRFEGKMGASLFSPEITGEGFCRVVGTEDKPGDSIVEKIKKKKTEETKSK